MSATLNFGLSKYSATARVETDRWAVELAVTEALSNGRFSELITAYNLFPADAERTIALHFTLTESLPSPDGLNFAVYHYHP